MPFLAITLLGLLNGSRIPKQWANKVHTNIALGICALLFASLGVSELVKAITKAVSAFSG